MVAHVRVCRGGCAAAVYVTNARVLFRVVLRFFVLFGSPVQSLVTPVANLIIMRLVSAKDQLRKSDTLQVGESDGNLALFLNAASRKAAREHNDVTYVDRHGHYQVFMKGPTAGCQCPAWLRTCVCVRLAAWAGCAGKSVRLRVSGLPARLRQRDLASLRAPRQHACVCIVCCVGYLAEVYRASTFWRA